MSPTPQKQPTRRPKVEIYDPQRDAAKQRLNFLAFLLDSAIQIPGTKIRFGLDPLIGLVPGIGDAIGAILSSYILNEAAALGVPRTVLLRMSFNIAVDAVIGVIPFAGDLFDVAWKANLKNAKLINDWLDEPTRTARASRGFVVALIAAVIAFVIGLGALAGWVILQVIEVF